MELTGQGSVQPWCTKSFVSELCPLQDSVRICFSYEKLRGIIRKVLQEEVLIFPAIFLEPTDSKGAFHEGKTESL